MKSRIILKIYYTYNTVVVVVWNKKKKLCKEFHIIAHFPIFSFYLYLSPFIFLYTKKKSFITHIYSRSVQQNSQVVMMTIAQNARHEKYYVFVYNHIITIALSFPIWGFCTNLAHHYYIRVISHIHIYIYNNNKKALHT